MKLNWLTFVLLMLLISSWNEKEDLAINDMEDNQHVLENRNPDEEDTYNITYEDLANLPEGDVIVESEGEAIQGNTITNTMLNGDSKMVFSPELTKVEENRTLEWLGSGFGGTFNGRHYFHLIQEGPNRTKMVHGEKFSGYLHGLVLFFIGKNTLENFHARELPHAWTQPGRRHH